MKTFYLMRHGETLFNVRKKIQGWCDSPLTEKGIQQAIEAREKINGISFDGYYTSTSERCSDTLEIVSEGKVPYTRLKGLKERGFGIFEGESEDLHPLLNGKRAFDEVYPVYYHGESRDEVRERFCKTIDEIMGQSENHCVLICTHAGAIYTFLDSLMDNSEMDKIEVKNCSILKFEIEETKIRFCGIL